MTSSGVGARGGLAFSVGFGFFPSLFGLQFVSAALYELSLSFRVVHDPFLLSANVLHVCLSIYMCVHLHVMHVDCLLVIFIYAAKFCSATPNQQFAKSRYCIDDDYTIRIVLYLRAFYIIYCFIFNVNLPRSCLIFLLYFITYM